MRKVHYAALSQSLSSASFTAAIPNIDVDTFVDTGLLTSADGFVDEQVGIARFPEITASITTPNGLINTNGFSMSGFTGVTGTNELTPAGGLNGAGWSTIADISVDEFPNVDGIAGTTWFASTTGFTEVDGFTGVGSVASSDIWGYNNFSVTDLL
jgi:hypothetical protein